MACLAASSAFGLGGDKLSFWASEITFTPWLCRQIRQSK